MMIQIDDKIVSSELLTERFCCDLSHCKGICCVEGNAGAPLEIDEVEVLEHEWEAYRPYMKPEGIEAVERQGFHGSRRGRRPYHTADRRSRVRILVRGERRHDVRDRAGMEEGRTPFQKPISCHLYPIRLITLSNGTVGLNYHRWDVCDSARRLGRKLGTPVYRMLREPIVRRFGEPVLRGARGSGALPER